MSFSGRVTRRTFVTAMPALTAMLAVGGRRSVAGTGEITVWGPPAGPSITLVHAIASGRMDALADRVDFRAWRNPDELRAGLTSKTMELFVLPTQVAANLHNRGIGVRLVNVMTSGLLYVVAADPSIASPANLAGRTVAVPFRNDTPDMLFQRVLAAHNLQPGTDVAVQYTGTPVEAVQLMVSGRLDAALVPEPAASAAIARASLMGKTVARVIDLQKAWSAATGSPPVLPQAGMGITDAFREELGPGLGLLQDALVEAAASVNADPARAAADAADVLEMPRPVLETSIPHSNLVATPARQARPALEAMFKAIAAFEPAVIGGRLPPPDFYL